MYTSIAESSASVGLCLACSNANLSVTEQEHVEDIPAIQENGKPLDSGDVVENEDCNADEQGVPEDSFGLSKYNGDEEFDLSVTKQEPIEDIPVMQENGEPLDSSDVVKNEVCNVDEQGVPADSFGLSKDNSDEELDLSVTKQEPVKDIPAILEVGESLDSGDVVKNEACNVDEQGVPEDSSGLSEDNSDEEWEWPPEQTEQAAPVPGISQNGEIVDNLNIWSYFQLIKGGDGDKGGNSIALKKGPKISVPFSVCFSGALLSY